MKTEFLQTLKVNGQPLPKDAIDAILAENGKDIEAAKKPYLDYDTIKQQLKDAQTTLQGIQDQGTDLETARKNAQDWEKKYNDAVTAHQQELAERDFRQLLETAITGAKGKNVKAITALLDVDALRGSKNQEADIKTALEALMKSDPWAFGEGAGASGAGGMTVQTGGEHGAGGNGAGDDGVIARFRDLNPELKI